MGYRDYINRKNANNNNAEILTGFYWDFKMINWPRRVYRPSNDIFYGRLLSPGSMPSYNTSPTPVDMPGGFKNLQPGQNDHSNASLSLDFQDFADHELAYFFKDWSEKTENCNTKRGLPKADLVCDVEVIQLNANYQPVRVYQFFTGLIASFGDPPNFSQSKQPGQKISVTINFEFWDMKLKNHGE